MRARRSIQVFVPNAAFGSRSPGTGRIFQIAELRAGLGAALVLGANLVGDGQAVVISLARATELARSASVARDAAGTALKGLTNADLITRDALAIFGITLQATHVLTWGASERCARVAVGAARVVAAVSGAVGVEIISPRADTEKAVG